jgi:tripartite-type tricarboxylate transporter receptor subunit TctC
MMLNRRNFSLGAAAVGAGLLTRSGPSLAQDAWPSRPIKLVVGFSAGTPVDVIARVVADRLQARLGQPIVVDNRPGAGSALAAEHVARSPADGHTLLVTSPALVSAPYVMAKVAFDAWKDFTFIAPYCTVPMGLLASATVPVKNVQEFVALARSKPGKLQFGSYGVASTNNIMMQVLAKALGVEMLHIPYKDASQMYSDLIRGDIHLMLDGLGTQIGAIKAGQVKVLAVSGEKRYPGLPNTPTLSETVAPGFNYSSFFGIVGPAGMATPIVDRITRELQPLVQEPTVTKRMEDVFFVPAAGNAATLRAWMQAAERDYQEALRTGIIPKPV